MNDFKMNPIDLDAETKRLNDEFLDNHVESSNICHKDSKTYKITRALGDSEFFFIIQDISEMEKLKGDLEKIKKNKSLFLANANHQVRTPLNGIIGMLTLLEDTILSHDQKNYIEMLRECSINLMTIINDILDYSKLEAGKITLDLQCIDLHNCIESTNDIIMSKIYEKSLEYDYYIDENLPRFIEGDLNRIKQILLNLLSNAIKFTDKGKVLLSITQDDAPSSSSSSSSSTSSDLYLKFTIEDTGCGIDHSHISKLFTSYHQIQHNYGANQGTGLGLSIAHELVNLMNGKIYIDWTELDRGSRFCFVIKTKKCNDTIPVTFDNSHVLKNKTAFILDDKLENRLGLASMIQKWGMIVHTYSDPKEALFFLKHNTYDIGFVDICMPELNGKEFAMRLNQQTLSSNRGNIPLVALSSIGEHLNEYNYLFKAQLLKPVKESKLKTVCSEIFSSSKKIEVPEFNIKENIKILLAEDVTINQKVIINFLNKIGMHDITLVENGKECLESLTQTKYDIILLDIRMPIINGENVIKYINDYFDGKESAYKFLNNKKPITVAVTSYCLKEDKQKYLDMGFDDYLPKPININDLNTCMHNCIEKLLKN
jgi:signal transduction histidine kinase/two-component SAPR family response regulator